MNHALLTLLQERISSNLKRKTITSVSKWAEMYRVMGQPFPGKLSHDHHPWTKAMRDCECEMLCGQKAAQVGYTEVALDKSFKAIDIDGVSVLYVLPASNPDASVFSASRFDPALEMSKHLRELFSDVKNVGHKRAGNANLYIRGSRSRSQLKSVPVGLIILDEIDEFRQENIPMIFQRMSGQMTKQSFLLSTPTIDHTGINVYFRRSSQDHFFFVCPHCSRLTELTFPECLEVHGENWTDPAVEGSFLKCKECKHKLNHETKRDWLSLKGSKPARWVPTYTDRTIHGFYVSQLYSPTVKPSELAVAWLKAQTNPTDEQEFYNSNLGTTHVVKGARITEANLVECTASHKKVEVSPPHSLVTLGVDVGTYLHYEVTQWMTDGSSNSADVNLRATAKVLKEDKILHFEELDDIMRNFGINFCVIDANPERRKALEFAQRFYGFVRLCFYATGITSKQINIHADEEHTISVDRTSWIDLSLGRFKRKKILLPVDTSLEYKRHIKALVRVYKKDALGNPVGRYEKGNEEDHFAHSRTYSEIALQLAASNQQAYNITGVL